jgi:HEAT repeat protein
VNRKAPIPGPTHVSGSIVNLPKRAGRWYRRQIARWKVLRSEQSSTGESAALVGLRDANPCSRWESAALLGSHPQRSLQAIAALMAALADPEELVRWQAAEALGVQEADRVFPVLVQALDDPQPLRRAGAAEAIGRLGGEAASLTLNKHLADPDPQVRMAVAAALGEIGDSAAIPALVPLLNDGNADVRRNVAGALGRIGSPTAAAPLAAMLTHTSQPLLVRRAVTAALARAPHPDAQSALLSALNDPDPQVRGYAAQALGQIGNENICAHLKETLADKTPILRGTVGDRARQALVLLERHGRRTPTDSNPETR